MNKLDLYSLRKKRIKEFDKIPELKKFLDDILGKKLILLTVVGYSDFPYRGKIEKLYPSSNIAKLTVQNYLECLKQITEEKSELFTGKIRYSGIDSFHYSNYDSEILQVCLWQKTTKRLVQTFDISFYYSATRSVGPDKRRNEYTALSSIPQTLLEKMCKKFVGPAQPSP